MSGYAKRMMAAALPWMAENPVPFDGRIRVPRERHMEWTAALRRTPSSTMRSTISTCTSGADDSGSLNRGRLQNPRSVAKSVDFSESIDERLGDPVLAGVDTELE